MTDEVHEVVEVEAVEEDPGFEGPMTIKEAMAEGQSFKDMLHNEALEPHIYLGILITITIIASAVISIFE